MMHLRQPILLPKEQSPRVLILDRFSTEEQRQSSIDDQVASCRAFLESNLPKDWKPQQVVIDVIAEPEVSGEITGRPGINLVCAGIEAERGHRIIAEESSRLCRHHTTAGDFFASADGLWARGAAVGNTVTGYKRRPTLPATEVGEWLDSITCAKAKWSRQVKWRGQRSFARYRGSRASSRRDSSFWLSLPAQ